MPFRTWNLPGDVGTVSLPDSFSVEIDDEKTLLAAPASRSVIFRFSSISFTKKRESGENAGRSRVREKADEEGHPYYEIDGKGILSFEEHSEQNGHPITIKFWYVGEKSTRVIVSATFMAIMTTSPEVQELLDSVSSIVESVTINLTHRVVESDDQEIPNPQSL